jgi:hypothetical protein
MKEFLKIPFIPMPEKDHAPRSHIPQKATITDENEVSDFTGKTISEEIGVPQKESKAFLILICLFAT